MWLRLVLSYCQLNYQMQSLRDSESLVPWKARESEECEA
jgi:hypothetical protein